MRRYIDFEIELDRTEAGKMRARAQSRFGGTDWHESEAPEAITLQKTIAGFDAQKFDADDQHELGVLLRRAMLPTELRELLLIALGKLGPDEGLRIVLQLNDPGLAAFPWEFVKHPDPDPDMKEDVLVLDPRVSLVRQPAVSWVGSAEHLDPRVRRMVYAEGSKLGRSPAADTHEGRRLKQRIEPAGFECDVLVKEVTIEDIDQALNAERPASVFHFSGHGTPDSLIVAKRRAEGERHLPPEELVKPLLDAGVRLVVLAACSTGTSTFANWDGFAATLIKAGVPAVVAMQQRIENRKAGLFALKLHEEYAHGLSVDEAVSLARLELNGGHLAQWGVPVLYTLHTSWLGAEPAAPARDAGGENVARQAVRVSSSAVVAPHRQGGRSSQDEVIPPVSADRYPRAERSSFATDRGDGPWTLHIDNARPAVIIVSGSTLSMSSRGTIHDFGDRRPTAIANSDTEQAIWVQVGPDVACLDLRPTRRSLLIVKAIPGLGCLLAARREGRSVNILYTSDSETWTCRVDGAGNSFGHQRLLDAESHSGAVDGDSFVLLNKERPLTGMLTANLPSEFRPESIASCRVQDGSTCLAVLSSVDESRFATILSHTESPRTFEVESGSDSIDLATDGADIFLAVGDRATVHVWRIAEFLGNDP